MLHGPVGGAGVIFLERIVANEKFEAGDKFVVKLCGFDYCGRQWFVFDLEMTVIRAVVGILPSGWAFWVRKTKCTPKHPPSGAAFRRRSP